MRARGVGNVEPAAAIVLAPAGLILAGALAEALAADTRAAVAAYKEARAAANAADATFKAAHPEAYRRHAEEVELERDANHTFAAILVAEVARHLPLAAPSIRLTFAHALSASMAPP